MHFWTDCVWKYEETLYNGVSTVSIYTVITETKAQFTSETKEQFANDTKEQLTNETKRTVYKQN